MKEVKILNFNYEIVETECIEHGGSQIGQIDYLNQKIYIKRNIAKERKS